MTLISFATRERYGREAEREYYGEYADEGHDNRIEKLYDEEQLLKNQIAHLDGEYDYGQPMNEMDADLRQELEAENYARDAFFEQEQDNDVYEEPEASDDEESSSDMNLESDDY